jgi:hypothetical protein
MPLTKQGNFTFNHVDQQDDLYKSQSALEIKTDFDSRAEELKVTLNNLIDALNSTETGDSGAKNISSESIPGLVGNDVYSMMTSLKNQLDSTVLGVVPDGSITKIKLDPSMYAQLADYEIASGSSNTYGVTLSPAPTTYTDGMAIAVKINVDATGACTLNVNGLGAVPLKRSNGVDVTNLKANGIYTFRYNTTTANFILQGEGGSGTAVAGDILSGKTASTEAGDIVGAMTDRGAMTITPGTTDQVIPIGFHNGSGKVVGDADLISTNILNGKNIFGVIGNVATYGNVTAGNNLLINNSTTANITSTDTGVYTKKLKETKVNLTGAIRVTFTMQQNVIMGGGTVAKIYVNGVAKGIERSGSDGSFSNPVTYTEDITVNSGDLVQIYGYTKNSSWTATVYDFKISINEVSPFVIANL